MLVAESQEIVCFNVETREDELDTDYQIPNIRKSLQQISGSIFSPRDTGSNEDKQ